VSESSVALVVKVACLLLVVFGILFSIRQIQLGVWQTDITSLKKAITYLVFPSFCLATGYISRKYLFNWRMLDRSIAAVAAGGLIYVCLCLAISRSPWWNLGQTFSSFIYVPWSSDDSIVANIRSVEQRAFPSVLLFTCAPLLLLKKDIIRIKASSILIFVTLISALCLYSLNGRLFLLALIFAMSQYLAYAKYALITSGGILLLFLSFLYCILFQYFFYFLFILNNKNT
jgi:hypothetical protein